MLVYFILLISLTFPKSNFGMVLKSNNPKLKTDIEIVSRYEWGARKPLDRQLLDLPVPYAVIHHSYTNSCNDRAGCANIMRSIQNYHMDEKGWWDIGYNFAVGGDGVVYEGRGRAVQGAHVRAYNNLSIGICLLGDWTANAPPQSQLKATKALIASGIANKNLAADYKLFGHRQLGTTECPGNALYDQITKWDH